MNLIYLLGAGRSGTTLLATVLGNQPEICTLGEMHQFAEHLAEEKNCSCGKILTDCEIWQPIIADLAEKNWDWKKIQQQQESLESHSKIPFLLLKNTKNEEYLQIQNDLFETIRKFTKASWYLDSSKYIARYLRLKKSKTLHIKGIYVVRDVRGVVNSFSKQVQTPKSPLSAIIYYLTINFFAEITYRLDKNIFKIRYEDFVENPQQTSSKILEHITGNTVLENSLKESFIIPHIIGGNRMKTHKNIRIKKDIGWQNNISRIKQVLYYILAAPIMLLNKYKI